MRPRLPHTRSDVSARSRQLAREFQTANDLGQFGYLAGLDNDPSWRSRPSRYAVRND